MLKHRPQNAFLELVSVEDDDAVKYLTKTHTTFVDVVDVCNDCSDENLEWTHSNCAENSAGQERMVSMSEVGPDRRDEEKQVSADGDWSPAEFHAQSICNEARDTNGEDCPA